MAARRAAVDVAELPGDAVDVGDGEVLDRRVGLEVQRREYGIGAEPRNRESTAIVGIRRCQNLGKGNDVVVVFHLAGITAGGRREVVNGGGGVERVEEEFGENLVGEGIGEELNGGDAAEDVGSGTEERGEVLRRGRSLVEMALREIVNPRIDGGDLDGGSGTCSPDFGVKRVRAVVVVGVRRRRWRLGTHD